jgi:hypothetical protein
MTSRTSCRAKSSNHGWQQAFCDLTPDHSKGRGLPEHPRRRWTLLEALLDQSRPSSQLSLADAHDDDEKLLTDHHLYILIPILSLSFFSFTGYPQAEK